jgi:hypothetical protein
MALGLLLLTVSIVAYLNAIGRWGVGHWRVPRGFRQTFPEFVDRTQLTASLVLPAEAQGTPMAVLGSLRALVQPEVRNAEGRWFPGAGVHVFSRAIVFLVFLTFLLPMWSLSFATESIGGDRESGSLIWLLTRPIPRWAVYLARFVALLPWALGLNLGGFALLCLAAGPAGRLALTMYWPAVFWATLTFAALFLLVGALFRRPAIVAVIYSFCLEMVLGNLPGYLKRLSVSFYARCLMSDRASEYGIQTEKPSVYLPVDGTTALVVLIAATAVLLGVGMWAFTRAEYHEVD